MRNWNIAALIFVLILLYLLVGPNSKGRAPMVINALSNAGTNTILALQGRFAT